MPRRPAAVGRAAYEGTPPATWKIGRALLQGDAAEAFRVVCASALSDFATSEALPGARSRHRATGTPARARPRRSSQRAAARSSSAKRRVARACVRRETPPRPSRPRRRRPRRWAHAALRRSRLIKAPRRRPARGDVPAVLPLVGSAVDAPDGSAPRAARCSAAGFTRTAPHLEVLPAPGVKGRDAEAVVTAGELLLRAVRTLVCVGLRAGHLGATSVTTAVPRVSLCGGRGGDGVEAGCLASRALGRGCCWTITRGGGAVGIPS